MTPEERVHQLEQENKVLRQQVEQRDELITHLQCRIQALEERLSKDSHNSHLPPSSERFRRQPKSLRKRSGKKPGGQAGHQGTTLSMSAQPDEVIVYPVARCQHCQWDLQAVPACAVERRQVVDVPPVRLLVREYQAEQKHCPHCQQITAAAFPEGVHAPVQYGVTIGAMAIYLVEQQLLPWARACEVIEDLLGVSMSEGTLAALIETCAQQLGPVEQQIKEALRRAEVLHQDETGLYVAGKRNWVHVTCTPKLTHYQVHAKRGQAALEAIGILPQFAGTSVHDGWGSYWHYTCAHALCNVHLLRELTFLEEIQKLEWAGELKTLLLDMKEATEQARALDKAALHVVEVDDWKAQYLSCLDVADQAHPPAQAPPGTRGRPKQSAARNLLARLRRHQEAVLAFLHRLVVPFDNNQAERDLRMIKVQQKVSGSFRSWAGAQAFCRIRGYLSTLRKQGVHLLSALQATLLGHPILPSLQAT